jgi:hypothetical protein
MLYLRCTFVRSISHMMHSSASMTVGHWSARVVPAGVRAIGVLVSTTGMTTPIRTHPLPATYVLISATKVAGVVWHVRRLSGVGRGVRRLELARYPATVYALLRLRGKCSRHAHHGVNWVREAMARRRILLPCRCTVLRLGYRSCRRGCLIRGHILIKSLGLVNGDESTLLVLNESGGLKGRLATGTRWIYVRWSRIRRV